MALKKQLPSAPFSLSHRPFFCSLTLNLAKSILYFFSKVAVVSVSLVPSMLFCPRSSSSEASSSSSSSEASSSSFLIFFSSSSFFGLPFYNIFLPVEFVVALLNLEIPPVVDAALALLVLVDVTVRLRAVPLIPVLFILELTPTRDTPIAVVFF